MKSSAQIARENGWQVGDYLYGHPTTGESDLVMRITAIGESMVLGVTVQSNRVSVRWPESSRDFKYRRWEKIDDFVS